MVSDVLTLAISIHGITPTTQRKDMMCAFWIICMRPL